MTTDVVHPIHHEPSSTDEEHPMDTITIASTATTPTTSAIDDLAWDEDWGTAAVCAIENGPDCEACEG